MIMSYNWGKKALCFFVFAIVRVKRIRGKLQQRGKFALFRIRLQLYYGDMLPRGLDIWDNLHRMR